MRLRDLILLTVLTSLFFGIFLGSRPLSVPDEGRYVEIPREMVVTGDYLTPRLNGVKYFEKPPLFYWFEAGAIKLFGLSEWSVRLVPVLFALFGCLAVYYAGARMFGRLTGLLSACVLATSILYYALSRLISPDMPVSVLLTASLLSFLLGTREPAGTTRRFFFWGFYAFAALATLTKGLIGIVFPGMIIFTWMLFMNEWRTLRSMYLVSGTSIFLLIAAPWHILVGRENPEFFDFYFIREHFQRFLTTVHHHFKPFWFFIPILVLGFFPWSAFLVQAVRQNLPPSWKDRHQHKDAIFLMLWACIVFLFFSASSSKLIPYILPVLPPLALLTGRYLAVVWKTGVIAGLQGGLVVHVILSILISIGLLYLPRFRPVADAPVPFGLLYFLASMVLFGSASALLAAGRRAGRRSLVLILLSTMVFLTAAQSLVPAFDTRSLKPLALVLKPLLQPGDEVATYLTYYQDLPVYLERRVTVVDWTGEMDFGTKVEDVSGWMIGEAEFRRRWQGPDRIFLVASKKDADAFRKYPGTAYFPVARNKNTVILSNTGIKP
jgi:4-amino-4-deoxy-L-arabinose transferase-like glycosyltransferase